MNIKNLGNIWLYGVAFPLPSMDRCTNMLDKRKQVIYLQQEASAGWNINGVTSCATQYYELARFETSRFSAAVMFRLTAPGYKGGAVLL